MIKEYYYSTLNDKLYATRYDAEKAEDEYVENYFEELDRKAAIKRRKLKNITKDDLKHVKKIYID